jgi:hypothetical protein
VSCASPQPAGQVIFKVDNEREEWKGIANALSDDPDLSRVKMNRYAGYDGPKLGDINGMVQLDNRKGVMWNALTFTLG